MRDDLRNLTNPVCLILLPYLLLLIGCSSTDVEESSFSRPTILEIDRQQVVIGETVFLRGKGLINDKEGVTRLNFLGEFKTEDGEVYPVDTTITPSLSSMSEEEQILRWSRVGPFNHPFIKGEEGKEGSRRVEGRRQCCGRFRDYWRSLATTATVTIDHCGDALIS